MAGDEVDRGGVKGLFLENPVEVLKSAVDDVTRKFPSGGFQLVSFTDPDDLLNFTLPKATIQSSRFGMSM
jgi:hypothetical protein